MHAHIHRAKNKHFWFLPDTKMLRQIFSEVPLLLEGLRRWLQRLKYVQLSFRVSCKNPKDQTKSREEEKKINMSYGYGLDSGDQRSLQDNPRRHRRLAVRQGLVRCGSVHLELASSDRTCSHFVRPLLHHIQWQYRYFSTHILALRSVDMHISKCVCVRETLLQNGLAQAESVKS